MSVVGGDRDALEVSGPEATAFLQGQLSQDIDGVGEGQTVWSFILQPQGKVDALVRVTRLGPERWLLDVDGGYGDAVKARLERFKLRTKAEIAPVTWSSVVERLGLEGTVPAPDEADGIDDHERHRIVAGWPKMGAEITDTTIPHETGIVDRTVSFTKGCFTGQELVARMDSRGGNAPRRLRGVVLEGAAPVGARIEVDGNQVGELTSVAGDVALAYVRRGAEPPLDATVAWDGGSVGGRIEPLPLSR